MSPSQGRRTARKHRYEHGRAISQFSAANLSNYSWRYWMTFHSLVRSIGIPRNFSVPWVTSIDFSEINPNLIHFQHRWLLQQGSQMNTRMRNMRYCTRHGTEGYHRALVHSRLDCDVTADTSHIDGQSLICINRSYNHGKFQCNLDTGRRCNRVPIGIRNVNVI